MFLLDTDVVSELRKAAAGKADARVVAWAGAVAPTSLFVSAITILELEMGVLRRDPAQGVVLRRWLEDRVLPSFDGRVLAVDVDVARRCATLQIPDLLDERDALIAATALVHGMTVATRNVRDFPRTGATLVDPWGSTIA